MTFELAPDWLRVLVDVLSSDQCSASAAGKILDYSDRQRIQEAGSTFAWEGRPRHRGAGELDVGQYDEETYVFSVCAGAALYRRAVIQAIGGFDAAFFAYLEDTDWGFRAQLAGYRAIYTPTAVAYHIGSATTNAAEIPVSYLSVRNTLALIAGNYPKNALVRYSVLILTVQARYFVGALKRGLGSMYLRAYVDFLRMYSDVLKKRRRIAAIRGTKPTPLDIPVRHDSALFTEVGRSS